MRGDMLIHPKFKEARRQRTNMGLLSLWLAALGTQATQPRIVAISVTRVLHRLPVTKAQDLSYPLLLAPVTWCLSDKTYSSSATLRLSSLVPISSVLPDSCQLLI